MLLSLLAGAVAMMVVGAEFFHEPFDGGWPAGWKFHPANAPGQAPAATPPDLDAPAPGDWRSPAFAVSPTQWHRLRLRAGNATGLLVGVVFLDDAGAELIADCYTSFDAANGGGGVETFFRGRPGTTRAYLKVHASDGKSPVRLESVQVQAVELPVVAEWADRGLLGLPAPAWAPPGDRFRHLPRTLAALRDRRPLRIVLLGDSIANDTSNSPFDAFLARALPGLELTVIPSVRSCTGCEYYSRTGRVAAEVLAHRPDLLVIGGISHRGNVEAIRSVVRQVRAASPAEILLLTSAVAAKFRRTGDNNKWMTIDESQRRLDFFGLALQATATFEQVGFFDFQTEWDRVAEQAGFDAELLLRDILHANDRGRAVLARAFAGFLDPTSLTH